MRILASSGGCDDEERSSEERAGMMTTRQVAPTPAGATTCTAVAGRRVSPR